MQREQHAESELSLFGVITKSSLDLHFVYLGTDVKEFRHNESVSLRGELPKRAQIAKCER